MSAERPSTPTDRTRAAFLRACTLDVAVRKPGNVSLASPGHGMHAALFLASARAAADALLRPGAALGQRLDEAGAASWAAAGCNTNLGILLLCAPLAVAAERCPPPRSAATLRRALRAVLAELDRADAVGAFRAIARANPGGLGQAASQDVRAPPTVTLREAMVLAAGRDSVARQYANGYVELFELALPLLPVGELPLAEDGSAPAATASQVQAVFLALLAALPDSHIVRRQGEAVAQIVMRAAQGWHRRTAAGEAIAADPAFADWDESLKRQGINPGTSADLTVAALFAAGLLEVT